MRPDQRPSLDLTLPDTRPAAASHLPDITSVLPWRTWDDGLEEARRRGMPILAFAEPSWANSAQRIALRLQQEDGLRDLLANRVVPVLVDPEERPDLVVHWRWAAMALTGTAGPPLMVFLTHEGLPFLAYCTMNIEGDETYPSLQSLIESLTENYGPNAESIVAESRNLSEMEHTADREDPGWESFRERLDLRHGGMNEAPKHPRPELLSALLDAHAAGSLPEDIASWLDSTLDRMIRGAIWDQIDRGFHRCARDDRWIIPHFEKPIPLNARLAAVYARAADLLGNDTYRDIASRLVTFCLVALREGVDIVGSDTGYYTWTSRELLKTLDPKLVQVVTLHFDLKPVDERQALRRVVEMEDMDRFSHEDIDVLRTRLVRGRAQLKAARQRRSAPQAVTMQALAWRADTVRWLLATRAWSDAVDAEVLVATLEALIDGRFDPGHGYARTTTEKSGHAFWLEDQAALLAAFVAAHRGTSDERWLARARELADVLMTEWWSDAGWLDRPGSTVPSFAVIDDVLSAAIPTLTEAFRDLAGVTGDRGYARRAEESGGLERTLAAACGHWSAALPHF